jgi:penicillin-binding protein 1A
MLNFLWLFGNMPGVNRLDNPQLALASEVYSADGVLLGKFFRENREPVNYNEIGKPVIEALVVTEDVRFYKHNGIDIKGMFGAAYQTVKGDRRGGSTITQQLAKNLYKTRKNASRGLLGRLPGLRTLIIKTKEWITAVRLESRYTKQDILEMYLNTVDFGHNTYGISVAAKTYYGVKAGELSVEQAATLIGMLKAPTYYSPVRNAERCLERRNTVLGQMYKYGKINKAQFDSLKIKPLGLKYKEYNYAEGLAPYFRTAVARSLEKWMKKTGNNIYTGGYRIYTTLNSRLQAHAENAVKEQMKNNQKAFDDLFRYSTPPWKVGKYRNMPEGFLPEIVESTPRYKSLIKKFKNNKDSVNAVMNRKKSMMIFTVLGMKEKQMSPLDSIKYYLTMLHCGLVSIDPRNGHVKAYVGGLDYNHFKFDHAGVGKNQPGSTFKPFVYATAIEKGWGPCDKVLDAPVVIKYTEKGKKKTWMPHNADWECTNMEITLRHAMGRSVNTVAARLTEKVGWVNVINTAHKMGITSPLDTVPSIGLGSCEVTLMEMIAAYSVFMNKGIYTTPLFVTKITDMEGNTITEFKSEQKRAITEESAWLMTYMLRGGMEEPMGTSLNLWSYPWVWRGNQVGGKTGTSSNYSDGWYIGVTEQLVTGVWVGADDNRIRFHNSQSGEGAKTAMPIFGLFMQKVYDDKKLGWPKSIYPKEPFKIKKYHNCRTILPEVDSLATDSLLNPESILDPAERVPE